MKAELALLEIEAARIDERRRDLQTRIAKELAELLAAAPPKVLERLLNELSADVLGPGAGWPPSSTNRSTDVVTSAVSDIHSGGASGNASSGNGSASSDPMAEVRQRVRAAFAEGVKTLADLAREEGISKATLVKWRAEWGLSRPRGRTKAKNSDRG